MRRFLPFLFLGIVVPTTLHAEALGPWVQGVLEKAQAGMRVAEAQTPGSCRNDTMIPEIWESTDSVKETESTSVEIGQEMEFFTERTVCFENDRYLLEQAMHSILGAMNAATAACNSEGVRVLRDTYRFVHDAYVSYMNGALDPSYKDDRLRRKYLFEDEALWVTPPYKDAQYDKTSTAPISPYSTEYGPHTIADPGTVVGAPVFGEASPLRSYGCDAMVLRSLGPPFADEATALATFMDQLDAFARPLYTSISHSLRTIDDIIAVLTGKKPPDILPGPEDPLEHDKKHGALRPHSPEEDNGMTPREQEATLQAFPNYFDPENARIDPATGETTFTPRPEDLLPVGMLFRPLESSPIASILNFVNKKADMGTQRPSPDIFEEKALGIFSYIHQTFVESPLVRFLGANSERQTALVEASNRDPLELSEAAAEPLHRAVVSLTDVVENFLPKQYIPSVAFFLARSCVDGHCQNTLRTVLKRIHNPMCHPYISGEYEDEGVANKCFCVASVEDTDPVFWAKYCKDTLSPDEEEEYRNRPPEKIAACLSDEEEAARIEASNKKHEEEWNGGNSSSSVGAL